MDFQMILIGAVILIIAVLVGFANYKSAMQRSKQIYCDVKCKDEESCDFLETDK